MTRSVEEVIERGRRHLVTARDGNLPRGAREVLWEALGPWRSPAAWNQRARLALAAATAVRDGWAARHPGDDFVERALAAATAIIDGTSAGDAEEAAHRFGADFIELDGMDDALPAAWAATKAVYVAAFDETFDSENPDWERPDFQETQANDAAFFAAWARSGEHVRTGASADARRAFWLWWLEEAGRIANTRSKETS
jgi:Immunity protein Imm5